MTLDAVEWKAQSSLGIEIWNSEAGMTESSIRLDEGYTRETRDEIKSLIHTAKIFCKKYGLGEQSGSGMLYHTLITLAAYFPDTSAAGRMCSLLLDVAHLEPESFQDPSDRFDPDDLIGSLEILEEAIGLKQKK
jgi:hypothetical protein